MGPPVLVPREVSRIPQDSAPGDILFVDGCNNSYFLRLLTEKSVEFIFEPITPMMSSSGMYSGGEPVHHVDRCTRQHYDAVAAAIHNSAAFADPSDARNKGTALVVRCPSQSAGQPMKLPLRFPMRDGKGIPIQHLLDELR